jgi:limonene-1,2-epoxide hydrolase
MSNEQTFLEFIATWEHGNQGFADRVRELFTDDCTWVQPGLPTTTGPQEAVDLANGFEAMGMTSIRVILLSSASSPDGDTVFTERIDEIVGADGAVMMSVPVVGVTRFRDGKICAWREYFDSAVLAPPS